MIIYYEIYDTNFSQQARDVGITSYQRRDVDTTLIRRHMPAGRFNMK